MAFKKDRMPNFFFLFFFFFCQKRSSELKTDNFWSFPTFGKCNFDLHFMNKKHLMIPIKIECPILPLHRLRHLPMLEWCRKVSTFKIGLQTNSDKFCQCDANSICLNELSKWDEIYRPQVGNPISGPWNFSLCVIETAYLSTTVLNFKQGKKRHFLAIKSTLSW